ncbi:MAG: hypothetical protein Q8T09_16800 [Candidatus Melainabacteria bacterium]|nr:hypothetical protein [Candidatus Melainabacteria bacterium]
MTSTTTPDFDLLLQRYLVDAKGHIAKMAMFAFFVCLLPLAPLLLKIEFLWMLVVPIAAALFVGRGLQSVLLVKQRAVAILKSNSPTKMSVTGIGKQFLFWNSESSPGYKLDLAPLNSASTNIQKLKVDPASKAGVETMAALQAQFEQARETSAAPPTTEVDVYFDEKQLPVALVLNGELVWAVYWW